MSDERIFQEWQALREACAMYHGKKSKGPGGARVCICGAGCGGSKACNMLYNLRDFIRYIPVDNLPQEWQDKIKAMREFI